MQKLFNFLGLLFFIIKSFYKEQLSLYKDNNEEKIRTKIFEHSIGRRVSQSSNNMENQLREIQVIRDRIRVLDQK